MKCKTHLENFGFNRTLHHPKGITRDQRQCQKCRNIEKKDKKKCLLVAN
jgi:hypothetical protein